MQSSAFRKEARWKLTAAEWEDGPGFRWCFSCIVNLNSPHLLSNFLHRIQEITHLSTEGSDGGNQSSKDGKLHFESITTVTRVKNMVVLVDCSGVWSLLLVVQSTRSAFKGRPHISRSSIGESSTKNKICRRVRHHQKIRNTRAYSDVQPSFRAILRLLPLLLLAISSSRVLHSNNTQYSS